MTDPIAEIRTALEASGTHFEIIDCDPDLADTETFYNHYGYPIEDCANAILVKTKTGERKYAVCIVLAHMRLDVNKVIRKKLGARKVSFAPADETREITGMDIGGVTPIALPEGLPVWVDAAVIARQRIILGGGSRSFKVFVTPEYFRNLPGAEIVDGLAY